MTVWINEQDAESLVISGGNTEKHTWEVSGFQEYPNLAVDGGKIPSRG